MDLQRLDDACRDHLAHPAMPVGDVFTESMYAALEGPAAEGGAPQGPQPAPLTPEQWAQLQQASSMGEWVQWLLIGTAVLPVAWHLVIQLIDALAG